MACRLLMIKLECSRARSPTPLAYMNFRLFAFFVLVLVLGGGGAPLTHAHHGPPHEEVDEFDMPATRLAVPVPAPAVSWPAVLISVAGVAAVFVASRRYGIDAAQAVPIRARARR